MGSRGPGRLGPTRGFLMSPSLRVVLDTNVVLSALLFRGMASRFRTAWAARLLVPVVSRPHVQELVRTLAYPRFELTPAEQGALLSEYLSSVETVDWPARLPETPECRDPSDRVFLELALLARCDRLVTGDRDLLALAGAFPIPIVRPASLLAELDLEGGWIAESP